MSAPSDEELLKSDDPSGELFAVFYRRHVVAVLAYLSRAEADPGTVADVAAETFAAAALRRRRFDAGRGTARSWLIGIAQRKLADTRRRWIRQRRLQERLGMERVLLMEEDAQMLEELRSGPAFDALESLPPHQRQAIEQRVIHHLPYSEISQSLCLTEAATRQHVSRGLASMRRLLQGEKK